MDAQQPPPQPDTRTCWAVAAVCAGGAVLAWLNRFIQDDAFISLRYAENLVAGNGLVWNAGGERVEGYTNFLWTLILAVPLRLGIDPYLFVSVLGVVMMPVTLWLSYRLGAVLFGSAPVGLIAAVLLATNYTFICYATGGLETHMQALLCAGSLLIAARTFKSHGGPTPFRLLALSVVSALAVLTRLDSVLVAGVACGVAAFAVQRDAGIKRLLLLVLPGAVIVGVWLAWKVRYYGDLLPNTFYAKAAGGALPVRGAFYIASFLISYLLAPPAAAAVVLVKRLWDRLGVPAASMLLGVIGLWSLYLLKVGGDFMEFRFMVPVMPVVMLLTAWVIVSLTRHAGARVAVVAALVGVSALHAFVFDRSPLKRGLESIPNLKANLHDPEHDWVGIGMYLREALGGLQEKALIAVTPAGAIPYYSGLESVDMLGLSDRWVARHGATLVDRPGHQKITTVKYLVEKNVTFLIGHPVVVSEDARVPELDVKTYRDGVSVAELTKMFVLKPVPDPQSIPPNAKAVLIPFAPGRWLVAVYLTPTERWDAEIERLGWEVVELVR